MDTNSKETTTQPQGPIQLPPDLLDKDFWKMVVRYQFIYSLVGLAVGMICVILGMVMVVHGFGGGGWHWSADIFGFKVNDAAPGVVLFLVGLAIAQFTRFDVTIARMCDKNGLLGKIAELTHSTQQ